MDSNVDVMPITGILVNATAKFGSLSNIKHRELSDNEDKISYIIESLKSLLTHRNYLVDDLPNSEFQKELNEISLLLIVNCEFSKPFNVEEYVHLTFNVPKISKYLLSKLIVTLNLTEGFCSAVVKLPLMFSCELFSEFLPCLERASYQKLLQDTYFILHTIANILVNNKDNKHSDDMDIIERCIPEFFFRYSRVSVEQLPKLKKKTFFEHCGYALSSLLRLLVLCHDKDLLYGVYIDRLIAATTDITKCITLDIYVHWAEIDLDNGQSLQNEISECAYVIIEKYQQFQLASTLIDSLKPFSTKPLDIKDQIKCADIHRMVLMVDKADKNQRRWFQALIFSSFLTNDKVIECISRWSQLCDEDDVSRLLNISSERKIQELDTVTIKCCSTLNLQQFIVVITRHFYKNGFRIFKNDIHSELVFFFNSVKNCESIGQEEKIKLLLLILQNPETSLDFILTECLRSVFYMSVLKNFFLVIRNILKIRDVGLTCLQKATKSILPCSENVENYCQLFQFLIDENSMSIENFILCIVNPSIKEFIQNNDMEHLKQMLKVFNALSFWVHVNESIKEFLQNLFNIMSMRTSFMNHSSCIQAAVQEVVILITKKIHANKSTDISMISSNLKEDKFISYYMNYIRTSDQHSTLSEVICNNYNVENHTKVVCNLMQRLPSCVTEEWISIGSDIVQKSNCGNLLNLLNDMMILLCQFTTNQKNAENYPTLLEALKYCTQQVGIVIQNSVLSLNSSIENEILVTEALVTLLCHLPLSVKENEGLNLITIMTERSLKQLGDDKKFVEKICKIKNTQLCQVIAQKILG